MSANLVAVAAVMLNAPDATFWGYQLSKDSGTNPRSLYPLLRNMLSDGWLSDGWEDRSSSAGRPPRRYYQLTPTGKDALVRILATHGNRVRLGPRSDRAGRPRRWTLAKDAP